MRREAYKIGILLVVVIAVQAFPKLNKRSVDLNEQHKLESVCICDDLRPTSYILEIEPLINEGKFKGRVRINITWGESANKINLLVHPDLQISHSNVRVTRLNLNSTSNDTKINSSVKVSRIERNPRKFTIHLEDGLPRNSTCEVDITYFGNVTSNDTSGLFVNDYMDVSGQKHYVIGTYLRLNNARKMFPSFDELQYKAKFKLILTRPKNMTALSNTPLEKTTEVTGDNDYVQDHFMQTPEMTTYQLAFVISDFESIKPTKSVEMIDGQKLEIQVWGRKDYIEALKEVPDKIVTIINYLQNYFNSSIKLPKLDIVALPMYTASKASDNWGLMIFKESELSSPLIWNTAYELTYQWIGQYITPYRWMDGSENKGLNSFLASMTTLDINPDELNGKWPMNILYSLYYGYGKTFGPNRGTGIIRDAKFAKIELVFRMFHFILGGENFKTSMRHFVHTQLNQSSSISKGRDPRSFTQTDIYESMNFVANQSDSLPKGLTISQVADTWIDQERLPLVTVTRNYKDGTITFSQKPYVRESRKDSSSWESSYQWNIPLVIHSQSKWNATDYKPKAWLIKAKDRQDLTIKDLDGKDHFIIVNPEEIGLFPVNYDEHNWKLLSEFLQGEQFGMLTTLTRAKLLHDSWNLVYANELKFDIALNMTLFLRHEKSHVVWEPFFTMIDHIGKRIEGTEASDKFEAYAKKLLEPMYTEPCDNIQSKEPSWKAHIRGLARYFLCRAGYEPCIVKAREEFKKWMTDKEPDKGNPVANEFICPVFKWGTEEEWNFGLDRVINFPKNSLERKQSERTYLLKTLAGCPKDPKKIQKLLNVTIVEQNGNFSDADIHLILTMLTGSRNGYTTLFNLLDKQWDKIKERFENKQNLWTVIVQSATSYFNKKDDYNKVQELYKKHEGKLGDAESTTKEVLEKIQTESHWIEKNLPEMDKWLNNTLANPSLIDNDVREFWKTTLACPSRNTPSAS